MNFTVDGTSVQSWLQVTPANPAAPGFAASAAPIVLSFKPTSCSSLSTVGSTSTDNVKLLDASTPGKNVTVILKALDVTPLTATSTPSPASLTYVKGSGSPGHVDVNVTAVGSIFFSVDTSTIPPYLTVDSTSGTATPSGKSIRFSTTSFADTLAPGTYNATVALKVATLGDLQVPISVLITNAAPKLQISNLSSVPISNPYPPVGNTLITQWAVGAILPTMSITAQSTDSPISYSITTSGTLFPSGTNPISAGLLKGLAYNFGTVIPVIPDSTVFASAQPGDTLTGNVTFTWGNPSATTVVTMNVQVQSASASVIGVTPASVPTTSVAAQYALALTGSGFVGGTASQRTKVGVTASSTIGSTIVTDPNIQVTVRDSSTIYVTVNVPASPDVNLPFGSAGFIYLGVCNPPTNGTCTTATGIATLSVGTTPNILAVTSASSFQQVSSTQTQIVAPYDMLSIFGSNFCSGCSSSQILQATPNPISGVYATTLPDTETIPQNITVTFYNHISSGLGTLIAQAPLLFATNSQINLLAPSGLPVGSPVDIVVGFGSASSNAYTVNVVAANPGIFTIGADGQGSGAILNTSYALVSSTLPAGLKKSTASDTVLIYMTGLGIPDSAATDTSGGSSSWSGGDCLTPSAFMGDLNTLITNLGGNTVTTLDGAVLSTSALTAANGRMVPCFLQSDTTTGTPIPYSVSIGGQSATINYIGWTPDSIAGLYQINVQLPTNSGSFTDMSGNTLNTVTAKTQLPVVVTAKTKTSQGLVSMWVTPRLTMTAPTILSGSYNQTWDTTGGGNVVGATDGTSSYHFAVTTGLLPSGVSLNPGTGAITGAPVALGTYPVTVTATDSAATPVTGSVSFTLTVGLGLSYTNGPSLTPTYSAGAQTVSTLTASGGISPYTFQLVGGLTGMTLTTTSTTAAIVLTGTPAGTYTGTKSPVVQATDANGVVSTTKVPMTIALNVTVPATGTASTGGTASIATATVAGGTGTYSYAVDDGNGNVPGFAIDGTGVISVPSGASGGDYTLTVTVTDTGATPTGAVNGTHPSGTATITVTVS